MTRRALALLLLGLAPWRLPGAVLPTPDLLAGLHVQPLHPGIQSIRLAGHPATAVLAWRENYNAHGFTLATFYAELVDTAGEAPRLNLVSLFGGSPGTPQARVLEQLSVRESGGADCLLQSFRLLQDGSGGRSVLLVATREPGANYADPAPVHFDLYTLVETNEDIAGQPPLFFRWSQRIEASRPYCDVVQAITQELGYR